MCWSPRKTSTLSMRVPSRSTFAPFRRPLQHAFELARSKPRHLVPQPRVSSAPLREGLDGVIDSLLAAQHVLEMFRRSLRQDTTRIRLNRLSNRLTKILIEARNFATP